jgi:hypothetical protein
MRKLVLVVFASMAMIFAVACGDDNENGGDGPGPQFDGGTEGLILPEGGTFPEGGAPDAGGDECDESMLGKYCSFKACTSDTDCAGVGMGTCVQGTCADEPCGTINTCLTLGDEDDGTVWGVCTCHCTPDDYNTPMLVEDTCPTLSKHMCSERFTVTTGSCSTDADCASAGAGFTCVAGVCQGDQAFCMKFCDPTLGTNTCEDPQACTLRSGSTFGIYEHAICWNKGCSANSDCPVMTTETCDTHNDTCTSGDKCWLLDYRGECTSDADCDTPDYWCKDLGGGYKYCVHVEGMCGKDGVCDTASGLCDAKPAALSNAAAKVGDACASDLDCAANQSCLNEMDYAKIYKKSGAACADDEECWSDACTGGTCEAGGLVTVGFRNGYCTISGCNYASTFTLGACGADADCNTLFSAGICQKTCTLADAASCRGNANDLYGDYECRDWSNLGTTGITQGPVCDWGTSTPCSIFEGAQTDCSYLGDMANSNPTNMECKKLDKTTATNQTDPTGYCMDDTASGDTIRSPMPTQ